MSVNSVSASQPNQSAYATQKTEQSEAKVPGGGDVKNDHDKDDVAPSSGPSLNPSGQTVGTLISKSA